jgi:hypothetical protein
MMRSALPAARKQHIRAWKIRDPARKGYGDASRKLPVAFFLFVVDAVQADGDRDEQRVVLAGRDL